MEVLLIPFSFSFARALGLVVFLPFEVFTIGFGTRFIIAILLGLSGTRLVSVSCDVSLLSYILDFMLGFVVALPVVLLIQAADLWGDLFESLRGQTAGNIADPLFQGETSYLALFSKGLVWMGLISIGILETLFAQYLKSFRISALEIDLWQKSILIFCEVLNSAMRLVLPFAIMFLVVELTAMFSAKLLPGVFMITQTFTVKLFLGFLGILAILGIEPLSSLKIVLEKLTVF